MSKLNDKMATQKDWIELWSNVILLSLLVFVVILFIIGIFTERFPNVLDFLVVAAIISFFLLLFLCRVPPRHFGVLYTMNNPNEKTYFPPGIWISVPFFWELIIHQNEKKENNIEVKSETSSDGVKLAVELKYFYELYCVDDGQKNLPIFEAFMIEELRKGVVNNSYNSIIGYDTLKNQIQSEFDNQLHKFSGIELTSVSITRVNKTEKQESIEDRQRERQENIYFHWLEKMLKIRKQQSDDEQFLESCKRMTNDMNIKPNEALEYLLTYRERIKHERSEMKYTLDVDFLELILKIFN